MSKYAHVVKLAGSLIDEAYLNLVISKHRHYFGVAVAKDDKIMLNHVQQAPSADVLKQVQDTFKDSVVVFAFGDVGSILPEDMQPISLLKNGDGDDVCVVCLDGDFERHRKTNESHIGEYLVAKSNLEKRILKYASKGMDIKDIIAELNDDVTKADIANLWGNRGAITFMFSDGQVCTLSAGNEQELKAEWGYASNSYGFGVPVQEKKGVVAQGADLLKNLMTGSKPASAPVTNGLAASAALAPKVEAQTAVQEPLALPPGTVLVKPDFNHKNLDTRKKQRAFYEDRLGYEPQQYRNAPPLLRVPSADGQYTWRMADTKSMEILKHTIMSYPPKDVATPLAQELPQELQPKEEPKIEPVVQPEVTPAVVEPAKADNLPPWLQGKKQPTKSTVREPAPVQVKEIPPQQSKTGAVALPAGGNDQAKASVPATVSTARLPVLSPDQKQKMQEIMKRSEFVGTFGENKKQIIDPKALKAQIEQNLPDVAKNLGIGEDMTIFYNWKFEQFWLLAQSIISVGKNNPEQAIQMAAKMMFDLRNDAINQRVTNLTNPNASNRKVG